MFELSRRLLYYKRRDVQERIVKSCTDREVGVRYGDNGYGKRPDILMYETDVLGSVKNGATSFHVSEERWDNPLDLKTELSKKELDDLRIGWDLVLDIDCPNWDYSRLTAHLFIKSLRQHGITSISCKFSGNKGFHIGVPFEAFPSEINGMPIKNWFPDGPKKTAHYLLDYISKNLIKVNNDEISFDDIHKTTIDELAQSTGKIREDMTKLICRSCKKNIPKKKLGPKVEYICPRCETRIYKENAGILVCPKCSTIMDKKTHELKICGCGTREAPIETFDPLSIVDVDTILISSRHMYRAPFSLHEKSGLASITIDPNEVLKFSKEYAEPEKVDAVNAREFLCKDGTKENEAQRLMTAAFDFGKDDMKFAEIISDSLDEKRKPVFDELSQAIPVEFFPPCILKILAGLEDGKKRSLFTLMNFLSSTGWGFSEAQGLLIEWNKKNRPPLKERDILFQVGYNKQKQKKILPPNCRAYYQDFRVCSPDGLCERIKNPVQYAKRKAFALLKKKPARQGLSVEQKEMRKKHRQNLKSKKIEKEKDETKETGT